MRAIARAFFLPLVIAATGCATTAATRLVGQDVSQLMRELGDPQRILVASDGRQVLMWELAGLYATANDGYNFDRQRLRPYTRVDVPTSAVSDGASRERPTTPVAGGRVLGITRTFLVWTNADGIITKTAGARP